MNQPHNTTTLAAAVPDKTFLIKSDELHQNTVKGSGEIFASTRLIMILDIFVFSSLESKERLLSNYYKVTFRQYLIVLISNFYD